jgi:hypothetical protein
MPAAAMIVLRQTPTLATWELCEEMNLTSATVGPEVGEPELAHLEMAPSLRVKPPQGKDSTGPVGLFRLFVELFANRKNPLRLRDHPIGRSGAVQIAKILEPSRQKAPVKNVMPLNLNRPLG